MRTPMTIPAMAPPESPECCASDAVRVMLAPVATGASKGTVVDGAAVVVTTAVVLDVWRIPGPAVATPAVAPGVVYVL